MKNSATGATRWRKGKLTRRELKELLDNRSAVYNTPAFIVDDPVSIPHRFGKQQDIEIAGLFAAVLAWGQRKTIINKCTDLIERMDFAPYDFVSHHTDSDLKRLNGFVHRTFNSTDALFFISSLQSFYRKSHTLESAFRVFPDDLTVERGLTNFYLQFFESPYAPLRTRKHIATPERGSTCKRLNMFLRWMVRRDNCGVDFGLWKSISPSQLVCPCDVHVDRVARKLGLIRRKSTDWQTALELTQSLRAMDPSDPVRYDFALFGLGVVEKW